MAKPPNTPPHSDLDGVDEDRRPIDAPENSDPKNIERLRQEHNETKGRPPGNRRT